MEKHEEKHDQKQENQKHPDPNQKHRDEKASTDPADNPMLKVDSPLVTSSQLPKDTQLKQQAEQQKKDREKETEHQKK